MTRSEIAGRADPSLWPGRGERVLCAVSGGLDSMCLLDILRRMAQEQEAAVVAAHFNHGLRGGAADRDEEFVRSVCREWEIPFLGGRGDVREAARREGLSLEEAARKLRYAFLRRAAAENGCGRIYTAHHADDQAETVLLNLIRGTGLAGLAGMEPRRDGIYRPLLAVTRRELEEYARECQLPHVEDETNLDPGAAARNRIRLQVMPLLREINPRAAEHMSAAAERLRLANSALEEEAVRRMAHAEVREGRVTLSTDVLFQAPEEVRCRMLLRLFERLGAGRRDVGSVHLESVFALIRHDAGGKEGRISLPHGVTARCRGGRLILEGRSQALPEVCLTENHPLSWGDYTLTLLDRPQGEGLAIRQRIGGVSRTVTVAPPPPGERLTLPGSRGGRSVKRLCLDRRISPEERDRLPAVYADGKLAAVWRLGVDEAFLPEGGPIRFVRITKHTEETTP